MKHISSLVFGLGVMALQACSSAPNSEDVTNSESAITPSGSATITMTSDWGAGYCANVVMTNALSVATSRWQVLIDFKGLAIPSAPWNTVFQSVKGTVVNAHPMSYNTSIAPNGTTSFGFCGNSTAGGPRPSIKAYNMEMDLFMTCQSNSGINPTKAALAVAMATELGRWEPDLDLVKSNGYVDLASSVVCVKNGCANTKAILGQQYYTANQNVFNNTTFTQELLASFDRQKNLIVDLTNNHRSSLPISNYKLTLVGGPTSLGYGNCGPHYIYQVDYSSGTLAGQPLSATDAANLEYTLCFFGGICSFGGTPSNPYLGLVKTGLPGCQSGKMCIAIDPTDGDNGSMSTTTAGSAPTYPNDRVYNPDNSLLGQACISVAGLYGVLLSKCAVNPRTCGTLYCTPQ